MKRQKLIVRTPSKAVSTLFAVVMVCLMAIPVYNIIHSRTLNNEQMKSAISDYFIENGLMPAKAVIWASTCHNYTNLQLGSEYVMKIVQCGNPNNGTIFTLVVHEGNKVGGNLQFSKLQEGMP